MDTFFVGRALPRRKRFSWKVYCEEGVRDNALVPVGALIRVPGPRLFRATVVRLRHIPDIGSILFGSQGPHGRRLRSRLSRFD